MQSLTVLAGIVILEITQTPARKERVHPPFVMFSAILQQPGSKQILKIYQSETYLPRFNINKNTVVPERVEV